MTLAEQLDDQVEIAGVRCDAAWRCGESDVRSTLEVTCEAPNAPTLVTDDTQIVCAPSTDATVEEAVSFAHGRATWWITTDLPPAELSDVDC